jgi:hypothetical protein
MKFKLGDTIYDGSAFEDLSLRALLDLEKETTQFGRTLRMHDIEAMSEALQGCATDEERAAHPDGPWMMAVTIWAARRAAGDGTTFADAIDFPLKELQFIPDPADHKKSSNPTRPRVSAAVVNHHAGEATTKTSVRPSTRG